MTDDGPRQAGHDHRDRGVTVAVAELADLSGFLDLARPVEPWFGTMVGDAGFHAALERNIGRGTALCVRRDGGGGLRGGLMFKIVPHLCRIGWLVVSASDRGRGVGRALVETAARPLGGRGVIEVITFAAGHPAARDSGARAFYERLGFAAEEAAEDGPDGTPRQWYRMRLGGDYSSRRR